MRLNLGPAVVAALLSVVLTGSAGAIIGGSYDGANHPYVAYGDNGVFSCSATLLSPVIVECVSYQPRRIAFLGREGRIKHYGIALGHGDARPALTEATRSAAGRVISAGAAGFTIAHDAATAALAIVYWWANENELHARYFAAPLDDPGALAPLADAGLACVWELEVIDFERRAWLRDVLEDGDVAAYLDRALEEAVV